MGSVENLQGKIWLVILTCVLLVVGVFVLGDVKEQVQYDSAGDPIYAQLTTFLPEGLSVVTNPFPARSGNENTTHYVSIPLSSTIISATINTTGYEYQDFEVGDVINDSDYNAGYVSAPRLFNTSGTTDKDLHVFYNSDDGSGHVEYSYTDTNEDWTTVELTGTTRGYGVSSVFDALDTGKFWVAYQDSSASLAVANVTYKDDVDDIYVVDSTGENCGGETSIYLNNETTTEVGVAYRCETDSKLKFALFNGSWYNETVDESGNTGRWPVLLENGTYVAPEWQIFYINATDLSVMLTHGTPGSWSAPEEVYDSSDAGNITSIHQFDAVNLGGEYFVFFLDNGGQIRVAYGDYGSWTDQELSLPQIVDGRVSIVTDHTNGYIHVTSGPLLFTYDVSSHSVIENSIKYPFEDTTYTLGKQDLVFTAGSPQLARVLYSYKPSTYFNIYCSWYENDYPHDFCLDVGNNGTCDLLYNTGDYSYENKTNITGAVQVALSGCGVDPCPITFASNSSTVGAVNYSNLDINYTDSNRPGGDASNIVDDTIGALGTFGSWMSLIIIVIAAAFVAAVIKKWVI